MAALSDSITINGKIAKNRICFLPCVTFSFHGDGDDYFGSQHLAHYTEAAEGGAGIVYVQGTCAFGASDETQQWTPGSKATLSKIADVIHKNGALAMIQISWGGDTETDLNALSTEELEQKQAELLAAALTTKQLGFDGCEFHFGHAFLLCKLFDIEANKRTDRFGGSLENRVNIISEIIPEIREKNGDDFILAVRMGAYLPDKDTGIATARYLESIGINMLNITRSMVEPGEAPDSYPLTRMTYGGYLIKQSVSIPVIGVGGIRTGALAVTLIENGFADIAGVARGILADPNFPNSVMEGHAFTKCLSCSGCMWFTDHTKCPARIKQAKTAQ